MLLILSILVPSVVQGASTVRRNFNGRSLVPVLIFVLVFILFFAFFFWSRAAVIASV
jgi:hypothetical protein